MEFYINDKKSKVALCKKCNGFVLASHIDGISNSIEKEFSEFSKEGFDVRIESLETTNARNFVFYSAKKNGNCEDCNEK